MASELTLAIQFLLLISLKISAAAEGIFVPGPKIAAAPALYKNS